jgi:hypothetical protein
MGASRQPIDYGYAEAKCLLTLTRVPTPMSPQSCSLTRAPSSMSSNPCPLTHVPSPMSPHPCPLIHVPSPMSPHPCPLNRVPHPCPSPVSPQPSFSFIFKHIIPPWNVLLNKNSSHAQRLVHVKFTDSFERLARTNWVVIACKLFRAVCPQFVPS